MPNLVNSTVGVAPVIDDLYDQDLDNHPQDISVPKASNDAAIDLSNPAPLGKVVYGGGEYYPTLQKTLYILGRLHGSTPVRSVLNYV